jgi:hypothetical protein
MFTSTSSAPILARTSAPHFFLEQRAFTHGIVHDLVLAGLSDQQLRRPPRAGQNAIAFLVWHAVRWEDVLVNTWLAGHRQVIDDDDWLIRLSAHTRHVGTGMTDDEAAELAARVDVTALLAYSQAVGGRTVQVVQTLTPAAMSDEVDHIRLQAAAVDGAYANPRAAWLDGFFAGHDVAWHLAFLNVHLAEHLLGEALAVRGQLGVPLGL